MKFVSIVAATVACISTNVEGSFRGAKHAASEREERTRQLMMNPGGGGNNMDNMNGGGGGGVSDRDGCPDFRQGVSYFSLLLRIRSRFF